MTLQCVHFKPFSDGDLVDIQEQSQWMCSPMKLSFDIISNVSRNSHEVQVGKKYKALSMWHMINWLKIIACLFRGGQSIRFTSSLFFHSVISLESGGNLTDFRTFFCLVHCWIWFKTALDLTSWLAQKFPLQCTDPLVFNIGWLCVSNFALKE